MLYFLKISVSFLCFTRYHPTHALLPLFPNPNTSDQDATLHLSAIANPVPSNSQPLLLYRCRQSHVQPPTATVLASDSKHPSYCEVNDLSLVMPSLQRSARVSIPPDRYGSDPSKIQSSQSALSTTLHTIAISTSYSQATKEPCWQQAMKEELYALNINHTWDAVDGSIQ